jgi:hypothetical protein
MTRWALVNIAGLTSGQMVLLGARLQGNPERRMFCYGIGPPPGYPNGVSAELFADVTGTNPTITIQMASLDAGGAPPNFTVIGGDSTVEARSQILIADLGPR